MPDVFASAVMPADADTVWAVVRDFNGLPAWHPAIKQSRIEDGRPADAVGCIRNFQLTDDATIRECLVALDDLDRRQRYTILESPMALTDYLADLQVLPITDSYQSMVVWQARFRCAEQDAETLSALVRDGVFRTGLTALKQHFQADEI